MRIVGLSIAGVLVTLVSLGACTPEATPPTTPSPSESASTATPTATLPATPTVTPKATPVPSPTSPVSPTPSTIVYTFGDEWDMVAADSAQGSGCSPGAGALPDGVWFGFAEAWTTSEVTVDLACWYLGETAQEVAAARGEEADDFFIVNDNPLLRDVVVSSNAGAYKADGDGAFPFGDVIADPGGGLPTNHPYPVWVYINGGVATEVAVQYIP